MRHSPRDDGFTLIEVLVTIVLMGIVAAFAVSRWDAWARAREQSGTAREVQSLMRQGQQRAITEGRAMCVQFNVSSNRYSLYRGACENTARVLVNGPISPNGAATLALPAFTGSSVTTGVTFYSRGTATPGTVRVTSSSSSKIYTLEVEGLTGRVSLN